MHIKLQLTKEFPTTPVAVKEKKQINPTILANIERSWTPGSNDAIVVFVTWDSK